ncbi:MAG: TlyA family RNA methyltransferase [Leptospira sp.]|nr:TlyA family RNA methyltransferase [Leptospira sp.]
MRKEKIRLDELLLARNFAESIEKSRSLILSGSVLVNGQKIAKAGIKISSDSQIRILDSIPQYVGRGALKLKYALQSCEVNVQDKVCIDMGASTGGFTQILLESKAKKVYAFDVGYGQISQKLRSDPRVIVRDRFNVRQFTLKEIDLGEERDLFVTMDLSFISLLSVFPVIRRIKDENPEIEIEILSLIKPQFECRKEELTKGIVTDPAVHFRILRKITRSIKKEFGGSVQSLCNSPIHGADGNREFFVFWKL